MKTKHLLFPALIALITSGLSGCSTPAMAPLPADASPQAEISRASASLEESTRKQYDRLAPEHFLRAVDYRNSAREKLSHGASSESVLKDAAVSLQASSEVQSIGDANNGTMHGVLEARQFAVSAQAPQFQEKKFRSADKSLGQIGKQLETGKYQLDAQELAVIEKQFGQAEIASRKRIELGAVNSQIEKAKNDGAKKKTPQTLEIAIAKEAAAEQAIEMSPHHPESYSQALADSKVAAQKLTDVLAMARNNGASEIAALTIWNQNQALEGSRAALTQANAESEKNLAEAKNQADNELAISRAKAAAERDQLEGAIAKKDASLDQQHVAIAGLVSENRDYAKEEDLKQRIDAIKKTFSPDEAEVMKDGKKLVVRLKKMQFSTGRSELNPDSFATLQKVDTLIAAVPATQVTVEGHTDSLGSDKMNKSLSENRAEAVKKYLLSQGLSSDLKVATEGYGSDRPLTTNKTKAGRAINRRVDIVIETPTTL